MASWNLKSVGAVKPLGSLPPPKNGRTVAVMDKFMGSELTGAIINEKRGKNQSSCNLGFLLDVIFAPFKEYPHAAIHADNLMVTPSSLKEHSSNLLVNTATSEPHKPVHLYDPQKKQWNWAFPSGNSSTEDGLSNESQIALFFNTVVTAVANSINTDHTTLSPPRRRIWMADWSSRCLPGSTGYNRKPDLILVSNSVTSRDEVTWLSPKVIGEYSKEPYQPASRMGKTMDTKAYLVMVDQPWRRFVLGFSLANEELRVHFYDHSGGSISPPFNIHAEPDSFVYILSALVFGIRSCIGFDMTIKISPPPTNSRRPSLLESQPDQASLPVFRPAAPAPISLSSLPEAAPSIGTIQVGQVTYDIIKVLFSSTGFLGRGTICYLVRRGGEFYVIKDHWVQNDLKQNQSPLQEINMMKLIQGIDGVPTLVDYWVVEVLPGVPDVTQRYREEKWWRYMKSTRTHVRLVMKPCARPLVMFRTKKELVSCLRDILKSMLDLQC